MTGLQPALKRALAREENLAKILPLRMRLIPLANLIMMVLEALDFAQVVSTPRSLAALAVLIGMPSRLSAFLTLVATLGLLERTTVLFDITKCRSDTPSANDEAA